MPINTINPATGKALETYEFLGSREIEALIDETYAAFQDWRSESFETRAASLRQVAKLMRDRAPELGMLATHEMGKPITQSIAEVNKCADTCDYYAEHAEKLLAPRQIKSEYKKSYVCYEPMGVIFAVMPWNFPYWQIIRFAVPNLMAGNAVIVKPAGITTGCALAMQQIFTEANCAAYQTALVEVSEVEKIIQNTKIIGASLTGSDRAGESIGAACGKALKPVVMELGGSDPYLILEDNDDCNIEKIAEKLLEYRLMNCGQSCISAKRIIVVEKHYDRFVEYCERLIADYNFCDPSEAHTKLGPMAREDLRNELHTQVQETVSNGAKCLIGGEIPDQAGFYYPATLLIDVNNDLPPYSSGELFGPVVAILKAKDDEDALQVANDSNLGLAGAVFCEDLDHAEFIARRMEVGSVHVNNFVSSDPRFPFGGVKRSGVGRELAEEGIRAFCNVKTVIIE